jgi:hypothetical protein
MAKLKLTVGSLDDVNEAQRDLYVERDGKFELDTDGVPELRNALKTANREAQTLRTKFKDIDPEEVTTMRTELEELRAAGSKDAVETMKNQLKSQYEKDLTKANDKVKKLTSSLETALIDSVAVTEIAAAKGSPKLLLPHIKGLVKLTENDGQFTPQVLDTSGQPRKKDDGTPFTVKDLVGELRSSDEFGRAFDASETSGTGSSANAGGGGAAGNLKRSKMTTEQKSAYVRQHGQEKYLKLPY